MSILIQSLHFQLILRNKIQPLASRVATPNTSSSQNTPLLRRVSAAAAKSTTVPRLSANAFKVVTPTTRATDPTDTMPDDDDRDNLPDDDDNLQQPAVIEHFRRSLSGTETDHLDDRNQAPSRRRLLSESAPPSSPSVHPASKKARITSATAIPRQPSIATIVSATQHGDIVPSFREGAEIIPKKPKASDYTDVVQALAIRAASQYEVFISTKDSFPDTALRVKWAQICWTDANCDTDQRYTITDRINLLVIFIFCFTILFADAT
jgi:hypothetical protein